MSIDVDWARATSGPDGEALAERIRSFVHDKFQQIPLPRFIRSVQCHAFDFGTIAPDLEIKDFCDPFSDFYEEDDDDTSATSEELIGDQWSGQHSDSAYDDDLAHPLHHHHTHHNPHHHQHHVYPGEGFQPSALRSPLPLGDHLNSHLLPRASTPGIPGGTSTLGYHLMSLGGLSGTQTPLAAVAGATPFASNWSDYGLGHNDRPRHLSRTSGLYSHPDADTDPAHSASRPSTGEPGSSGSHRNSAGSADIPKPSDPEEGPIDPSAPIPPRMRERRPEDFQILCHAKYAGNIRLSLTAEILLDYPMPSFVGLPLKLNVTGITFDGVAVVAYIRKRIHFCFLSPEDADALLGAEGQNESTRPQGDDGRPRSGGDAKRQGGLLQEIRVDSEIGRKENGKQVLKNVGKVERFVLAQVRRIFEEELVYPSFWTFLI
ncbi:Mitochondrial distribution and morphology protein 12 [Penicillium oxalicum]|uniref:Mitochondrial distribution and morphology protein 12 n=1 Tax=Penicillium oxalicum (strain 114-2 / CGMCC 5302) TaxID=933388 RepID=S7Z528_PENO1|nr:Mitochondrial distribution and morphology protein 12 [Penicillium oxalicum]EPS25635.1 hypothetical protein PDE_00569 [Penicillium oxalicum 114-2]KAI2791152.1 Mitochondrial distribution and morphology protein 12 [Penicillium oxalicum]